MEKNTIGLFLAALRKANGLTQRQLADKLCVSDKAISRWERDEALPDLTLIPVIAEIFGITSDELLRGQRSTESAPSSHNANKTEKQFQNIIKQALTRYKIGSLISCGIALTGLIAALILNSGFLRAKVGFLVGCIFFIAAILCQSIFLILVKHSLADEEIAPSRTVPAQKTMFLYGEVVFGIIAVLIAFCLPLVLLPIGTFMGLRAGSWLLYGSLCFAGMALAWFLGCTIVNTHKGYRQKIDWHSPKNRFRLRWIGKLALILATLVSLHATSTILLDQNYHLLVQGKKFDNWDDFRRYMETPTAADGSPLTFVNLEGSGKNTLYIYQNTDGGQVVFRKADISKEIYSSPEDGSKLLVRYRHLNQQIVSVRYIGNGLSVQALPRSHMWIVYTIIILHHAIWCAGYIVTCSKMRRYYCINRPTE